MKVLLPCFKFLALLMMVAAARAAGPQASADYQFSAESVDGGGRRAVSADYTSDGSFSVGNVATSGDYVYRGGYAGQLNNPPVSGNYTLTVVSNNSIKVPISAVLETATDPDGDSVTFSSVASPSTQNGLVQRSGIWLLYKPRSTFTGTDTLIWKLRDSEGDQSQGTILAQVIPPPPPSGGPSLNLISVTFDSAPGSLDATLRFAGLPGETYLVQYCNSLTPPVTWITLGTAATTNGTFQIMDPTAGSANQRYYRTALQSP